VDTIMDANLGVVSGRPTTALIGEQAIPAYDLTARMVTRRVNAVPPTPPPFNPLNLPNLIGWWDASDAMTFTYSSGTVVSQWNDKSSNGYHFAQTNSSFQPSRSGTVNGLSTVVFDGSNDRMTAANFDMTGGGQKWTVWAVFTASSGTVQILLEHSNDYNANPGGWIVERISINQVQAAKRSVGSYSIFRTTETLTTTPKSIITTHDGTLSTDETDLYVNNGVLAGTRPINANSNSNNLSANLWIGAANSGTFGRLNGQVCELGIHTVVLSATERTDLQTYLAAKWGI
jgi:hypothetical protein